jgi:hypothetical protein
MSTPILKTLVADPTSRVELDDYKPADLTPDGQDVWEMLSQAPPYWWSVHDLLTVERYCQMVGLDRSMRRLLATAEENGELSDISKIWQVIKSASIEIKALEYALGLTPQARAALRLEAPPDQGEREAVEDMPETFDPKDL